jgi:TRAP-type C4-dicarboxylate transport system permease small subunit
LLQWSKFVSKLAKLNSGLERALGGTLVLLLAAMVLCVLWQVASRLLARLNEHYAFGFLFSPSTWTEELASFLLGWVAMLGAAYALRRGEHMGFDVFYERQDAPAQRRMRRLVQLLVCAFAGILLIGGGALVWQTLELGQRSPALGFAQGYVYLCVPLAALLMLCFALERVYCDGQTSAEANTEFRA